MGARHFVNEAAHGIELHYEESRTISHCLNKNSSAGLVVRKCHCRPTGMGIHCLHDFAHKQHSQLNSSVLITVWRVVIEV